MTLLILFVAVVGALPVVVANQNQQTEELSEGEAVELLRAVNTAQLELRMAGRQYGQLEQLLQHRFFAGKELGSNITKVDSDTGRKKGYEISVYVLGEGKRYSASVVPVERGCRVAFFTDESGVIYKGRALGCAPPKE
jgi:hypothetical protein